MQENGLSPGNQERGFNSMNQKNKEYVPFLSRAVDLREASIKLNAFYNPENCSTSPWIRISQAIPQNTDYSKPHVFKELGHYDMRIVKVQMRPSELAKQEGASNFVHLFNWRNSDYHKADQCFGDATLQTGLDILSYSKEEI